MHNTLLEKPGIGKAKGSHNFQKQMRLQASSLRMLEKFQRNSSIGKTINMENRLKMTLFVYF
jgi:hypothetical protein